MTPYLLEHRNPHGPHFYTARRGSVLACVVHITAGLQGHPDQADSSAERTARYAATTDRPVSWHSGSDTDSFLQLLPPDHTAFHVKGYNSRTYGHEISKRDISWADEDPVWVADTLQTCADGLRPVLQQLRVPARRASRAELDRAIQVGGKPVGLIDHSRLDPARRQDPGADFPWDRFLKLLTPAPPTRQEAKRMYVFTGTDGMDWGTDLLTRRRFGSQAAKAAWIELTQRITGVRVARISLSDAEEKLLPEVKA